MRPFFAKARGIVESSHLGTSVVMALVIAIPLLRDGAGRQVVWSSALFFALVCMAGFLFNDICDVERDRESKPYRPLVTGVISKGDSWACIVILAIMSFWVATKMVENSCDLLWPILFTIVVFAYNPIIRCWALAKNPIMAFGLAMPYAYVAACSGTMWENRRLFAAAFVFFLYRELLMDVNDMEGDESAGVVTLPNRVGKDVARDLVCLLWAVSMSLLLVHGLHISILAAVFCLAIAIVLGAQTWAWAYGRLSEGGMRVLVISMLAPMMATSFLVVV